jgi:hypothetical protein
MPRLSDRNGTARKLIAHILAGHFYSTGLSFIDLVRIHFEDINGFSERLALILNDKFLTLNDKDWELVSNAKGRNNLSALELAIECNKLPMFYKLLTYKHINIHLNSHQNSSILFTVVKFSNDSQVLFDLINRGVEVSNIRTKLLVLLSLRMIRGADAGLLSESIKMEQCLSHPNVQIWCMQQGISPIR